MAPGDRLTVLLLSVWLALTVVRQFQGRFSDRLTGWDTVGIIPVYRFFAPFPGRFDYHLLVRYQMPDGDFSGWFEIGPENRRTFESALFNPAKRIRKAQMDLVSELAKELDVHGGDRPRVSLSYPYLALLLVAERFIAGRIGLPAGTGYQFLVLASCGWEPNDLEPLMLSSLHRTDAE